MSASAIDACLLRKYHHILHEEEKRKYLYKGQLTNLHCYHNLLYWDISQYV